MSYKTLWGLNTPLTKHPQRNSSNALSNTLTEMYPPCRRVIRAVCHMYYSYSYSVCQYSFSNCKYVFFVFSARGLTRGGYRHQSTHDHHHRDGNEVATYQQSDASICFIGIYTYESKSGLNFLFICVSDRNENITGYCVVMLLAPSMCMMILISLFQKFSSRSHKF